MNLITIEEDKKFLENQRKTGIVDCMSSIDRVTVTMEEIAENKRPKR